VLQSASSTRPRAVPAAESCGCSLAALASASLPLSVSLRPRVLWPHQERCSRDSGFRRCLCPHGELAQDAEYPASLVRSSILFISVQEHVKETKRWGSAWRARPSVAGARCAQESSPGSAWPSKMRAPSLPPDQVRPRARVCSQSSSRARSTER